MLALLAVGSAPQLSRFRRKSLAPFRSFGGESSKNASYARTGRALKFQGFLVFRPPKKGRTCLQLAPRRFVLIAAADANQPTHAPCHQKSIPMRPHAPASLTRSWILFALLIIAIAIWTAPRHFAGSDTRMPDSVWNTAP